MSNSVYRGEIGQGVMSCRLQDLLGFLNLPTFEELVNLARTESVGLER
jgi:hypothetical protein